MPAFIFDAIISKVGLRYGGIFVLLYLEQLSFQETV